MVLNIFSLGHMLMLLSITLCEVSEKNTETLNILEGNNTRANLEHNFQNDSILAIDPNQELSAEQGKSTENDILPFGEYANKVVLENKKPHPTNELSSNNKPNGDNTSHNRHIINNKDETNENSHKADHKPKLLSNYNFASSTCGAYIINHSRRAKHTSEMLIDNPDSYALFPCINNKSKPLWFIIQLCEPIRIHSIYLSNMELFSSYVKIFRMSVTNQELLPNDSQWLPLESNFTLTNGVKYQYFSVDNSTIASNLYTRYVRIEIIEHYNMDFFCPISVFKVFGVSLVDELSGPSLDDNNEPPSYADLTDYSSSSTTFEDPNIIDYLYDLFRFYNIDKFLARISDVTFKCYQLSANNSYIVTDLINSLKCRSPTLNFIYDIFVSIIERFILLLKYLTIVCVNIYKRLFGIEFDSLDRTLISEPSSNATHTVDVNIDCYNEDHILNNSIYTLLTCTFSILKTPFGRDYCCTVKSSYNENSNLTPDCTLCNLHNDGYAISTTFDIIHSCFLEDFCSYFCPNNNTTFSPTGIVLFKSVNKSTIQISPLDNDLSNIDNTDEYNDNNTMGNTLTNPNNTTSNLPKMEEDNSTRVGEHPLSQFIITTQTINTTTHEIENNIPTPTKITSITNDDNITDNIGISFDDVNHTEYNYDHFIKQDYKDFNHTATMTSTESLPHENTFNNDYEFEIPKLKDIIQSRDENPLGYISRIKKNLTMTMKYLDEMSIKFKSAFDEIRKQISKMAEETNTKIATLTQHCNELYDITVKQNITITTLQLEIGNLSEKIMNRHGFYFSISLLDCCYLLLYISIISIWYKCCRYLTGYLLLHLLKCKQFEYFMNKFDQIHQKFMDIPISHKPKNRSSNDIENPPNYALNDSHINSYLYRSRSTNCIVADDIFSSSTNTPNYNDYNARYLSLNEAYFNGSLNGHDILNQLYPHHNVLYYPLGSQYLCPNCTKIQFKSIIHDRVLNNVLYPNNKYQNDNSTVGMLSAELSSICCNNGKSQLCDTTIKIKQESNISTSQ